MQRLALPFSIGLLVAGVGFALWPQPGSHHTDRMARTFAETVGYFHQDSARGYARVALDTTADEQGQVVVLQMDEIPAEELIDPLGELVFAIRVESAQAGLFETEAETACYRVLFNYYGTIGSPWRTNCPDDDSTEFDYQF